MADGIDERIIRDLRLAIADTLSETAIVARTADGFRKEGLVELSFQSLLDFGPQIQAIWILLNETSITKTLNCLFPYRNSV